MDLLQRRREMMARGTEPRYITDGLILWLDGIEKGASDGSWVDKIGGHIFTNQGGVTPLDNGFSFDGSNDVMLNTSFNVVTSPDQHAIEVVISDAYVASTSDGRTLFASYAATSSYRIKRFNLSFYGSEVICPAALEGFLGIPVTTPSDIRSIVFCPDGKHYINGDEMVTTAPATYWSSNSMQNRIGSGWYNRARHFYKGNIHAVRIYNRSLTAEEVAHNYAIDLRRFNL